VPAGAVRQRPQALPGITGRKGCVGGFVSPPLNPRAQLGICEGNGKTSRVQEVYGTHGVGVKSVDIMGNTKSEGNILVHF
jgi:hypothetical protein